MQVKVTGNINKRDIKEVIREGVTKPFNLEDGVKVFLGCGNDPNVKGMEYGILGPALISISNVPIMLREGILVLEGDTVEVKNMHKVENYIKGELSK
ncbi:hypothetical protein M1328_00345 [Patescibacteria group bacterium]|nr:hypothetical protein [Patescibacteria group bacterium]